MPKPITFELIEHLPKESSKITIAQHDRITWVDHARGLAIILVVYRHVVAGMQTAGLQVSWLMYNLQEVFHNFRMPVFFIISGVFLAGSLQKKARVDVAKTRAATLLYPYLLWALLITLMQISFRSVTNSQRYWTDMAHIITQPRQVDQMWYLLALFNTSILYLLLSNLFKQKYAITNIAVGLVLHIISFYVQSYSLISDMFYFYFYFSIGGYFSYIFLNRERRNELLASKNFKWVLPLFFVGQWFWFIHKDEEQLYDLIFVVINLIACYTVYLTAYRIAKTSKNEWLAFIGKHSLYIYILHVPFAAVMRALILHLNYNTTPWIVLVFCLLFGLLAPIVMINVFRNWGIEKLFSLQNKKLA